MIDSRVLGEILLPAKRPLGAVFSLAVLLSLIIGIEGAEASPRYAIVNAGKADHQTTIRLYALYAAVEGLPVQEKASRPAPREAAPREAAPREATPREATPREAAPREAAPREAAPRDGARPAQPVLSAIGGRALRRALLGLPQDETLSVVRAALATGRRLFGALEREASAEALTQAILLLDGQVPWSLAQGLLVTAHTYLLLCQHELGRGEAARKTAARLRELTGDQRPAGMPEPTWAAYPPAPTPLLPRRTLEVKAPPGARVLLDDHLAGEGPMVLHVGPGPHRVRVELKGHRVFFQEVPASEKGALVLVTLSPEPEDPFEDVRQAVTALRRSGKPFAPGHFRALGKLVSVDFFLVAAREGERLRLRFFSRNLGRFTGETFTVPLPGPGVDPQPLAAAIRAAFDKAREETREDAALARKAEDKGQRAKKTAQPSIWKKWYFWVAAAVVGGVVAAFAIKDSLDEEKVILKISRP